MIAREERELLVFYLCLYLLTMIHASPSGEQTVSKHPALHVLIFLKEHNARVTNLLDSHYTDL